MTVMLALLATCALIGAAQLVHAALPNPLPASLVTTLLPAGATWAVFTGEPYESNMNWKAPVFDQSKWALGAAPLGYGTPLAKTVLAAGPSTDKRTVTYFRHTFSATLAAGVTGSLALNVTYYDGCLVFVNGVEVGRFNIAGTPGTSVVGRVYASSLPARTPTTRTISLPLSMLRLGATGSYTVAASVHLARGTTSAMLFDASMVLTAKPTPSPSSSVSLSAKPTRSRSFTSSAFPVSADTIPPTATWRYADNGADVSGMPAWNTLAYVDAAWGSGRAPLGTVHR